jgi:hypothetical protein
VADGSGTLRATLEAAQLHADILFGAARAELLWARIDGDVEFRRISVTELEAIYKHLRFDLTEHRKLSADILHREIVPTDISLDEVIKLIARKFADVIGASDGIIIHVEGRHSDVVSAADERSIALQKMVADAIITVDGVSFSFAQSLADTLSLGDAASITVEKFFAETVTVTDNVGIGSASAANASDAIGASDMASIGLQKGFAETVSVSETFALTISVGSYPRSQLNGHPVGDFMLGD